MLLKKSLSLFLCAVLVLSLCVFTLPKTAKAYATSVFIGTFELNNTRPYYKNGGTPGSPTDYNAHYDPATGVLTLQGLNAQSVACAFKINSNDDSRAAIYAAGALKIEVHGMNRVSVNSAGATYTVAGVYVKGDLTIYGDGSLEVRGSDFSSSTEQHIFGYGVFADSSLTVSRCSVSVTAAAVTNSNAESGASVGSWGIYVKNGITIHENAHVDCEGGGINANNPLISYTCGAATEQGVISVSDGYLCATSGNKSAIGQRAFGIYAGAPLGNGRIEIKNSTVIAKSVPGDGNAIYVPNHTTDITLPASYKWRTASAGGYKAYPTEAYGWAANQTYVEICPTDPAVTLVYGSGGSVDSDNFVASADTGYVIDKMFVDGAEVTAARGEERYTPATLPTRLMFVCFKQTAASVLVRAGYGGSIGSSPDYAVTADSGYVIDELWIDGSDTPIDAASGLTSYTHTPPPTSSIVATFAYTVNFNTPANGTLTVARGGNPLTSGEIVRGGNALTITAAPSDGYVLSSLTVNGIAVTPVNNVYTYTVGTYPAQKRATDGVNVLAQGAQIAAAFAPSGTPVIFFTTQPAMQTTVTAGSINANLTASAEVTPAGTVQHTWYVCDAAGNITGSALATGGTFALPSTLTAGTYYYVCEATSAGAAAVKSYVATVTVSASPVPPVPPAPSGNSGGFSISGGSAYTGNQYPGSFAMGANGGPVLTVQAPCEKCISVIVDGVQLKENADYTKECGSTIVTFTPSYLATLANGAHSIRVQFTDGRYDGNFVTPFTAAIASAPMADVPATGDTPLLAKVIEWLRRGGNW